MSGTPHSTPELTQLTAQAHMSHDEVTCYDALTCGAHVGDETSNPSPSLISLLMNSCGTNGKKGTHKNYTQKLNIQ